MKESQLFIAIHEHVIALRLVGRADLLLSQNLRVFVDQFLINSKKDIKQIIVEFSECESLDSTFMGVLAMISLKAQPFNITTTFVNLQDIHIKVLQEIGLHHLWKFAEESLDVVDLQELSRVACDTHATQDDIAKNILEAHQVLMNLDPSNVPRFEELVKLLTADLANNK